MRNPNSVESFVSRVILFDVKTKGHIDRRKGNKSKNETTKNQNQPSELVCICVLCKRLRTELRSNRTV